MTRVGPYELGRELARGGQGVVYEARHVAGGQRVALKVLLDNDPQLVRRFRQEGQVLLRLAHPNLVRCHEVAEADGRHYVALEFIEGTDLQRLVIEQGPLELDRLVALLGPIAEALELIHERGLVHRDLKPANILVESKAQRPVLVDFGLVKRDAERFGALSQDRHSALSITGEIKGTPAYMAPEQADPSFGAVGPRSDTYSLACVLFFLLTGEAPYQGTTSLNVLAKVVSDPPPSLAALRPDVSKEISALCRRAMSKSPQERPASPCALVRELEAKIGLGARPVRRGGGRRGLLAGAIVGLALFGLVAFSVGSGETPAVAPGDETPAGDVGTDTGTDTGTGTGTGTETGTGTGTGTDTGTESDSAAEPDSEARPAPGLAVDAATLVEHALQMTRQERFAEAAVLLERAAATGDPKGMALFGDALFMGSGVPVDKERAYALYERAAEAGHVGAMLSVGACARQGIPRAKDYATAYRWFSAAAERGSAHAMALVAAMHGNGEGVPLDRAKAMTWLRRSANSGYVPGMVQLGTILSQRGPYEDRAEAKRLFLIGAERGDHEAMASLGKLLLKGTGDGPDVVEAARWFRESAKLGNPRGMYGLGYCYSSGLGVERDVEKARDHYRRSIEIDPTLRPQAEKRLKELGSNR